MEGRWRGAAGALLSCALIAGAIGCGESGSGDSGSSADDGGPPPAGMVPSRNLEHDFSPVVQLHPRERLLPVNADWFLRHSTRRRDDDNELYYDLDDTARAGPRTSSGTSVYTERRDERVDGQPAIRMSYWMLYGMNEPRGSDGRIVRERTHEGDWERLDVLLQKGPTAHTYRPVSVRLYANDGHRDVPWRKVEHVPGGTTLDAMHPVTHAALGSHELRLGRTCRRCGRWETWGQYREASEQPWYGFDGPWGEVGPTEATTGPLGPGAIDVG